MLTVKYLQSDACEVIGEFESVTAEIVDGHRVVHAHNGTAMATWGPITQEEVKSGPAVPTLYVMNRFGATVATYRL